MGDLILLMDFNSGTDDFEPDHSGFGNDGDIRKGDKKGGGTRVTAPICMALDFDGVNINVNVPHNDIISGLPAVTLTCLIKLDTIPSANSAKFCGVFNEYWFEYRANQLLEFGTKINGQYKTAGYTIDLTTGWFLIYGTYDGNVVRLYINNVQRATNSFSGTLDDTSNVYQIGAEFPPSSGFNGCPDGKTAEVRTYNFVLSAEERKELYDVNKEAFGL